MRRIRHDVVRHPVAEGRLLVAVVFSAALHILLIHSLVLRPGFPGARQSTQIQARLVSAETASNPVRRERVPVPLPVAIDEVVSLPAETIPVVSEKLDPEPAPSVENGSLAIPSLPDIPDLTHYAAKDLDMYPQLRGTLDPDYPESAFAQKLAGSVTLLVLVDEVGRVTETSVIDATPEGLFDDSAQEALSRAAFFPAQREGRNVRSRILVRVNYDPEKNPEKD
jgi:periplasmic protein TonB